MATQTQNALILAQARLNDQAGVIWTATNMLPFLKEAFIDLQLALIERSLPITRVVSASLTVTAGVTSFAIASILPSDIIMPIKLREKGTSEPNSYFCDMTQKDVLPDVDQTTVLVFWSWQLNTSVKSNDILLVGATVNRSVKLTYTAGFSTPTAIDGTTNLYLPLAEGFVGLRMAQLAAQSVGNDTLAQEIVQELPYKITPILQYMTRQQQSLPAKRIPYRRTGRMIIT